jgi:cytochrome b pre-mRNA-processing protein 3
MLQWLRNKVLDWSRPSSVEAESLYQQIASTARNPQIYAQYDIADTFDGRFDTLCLVATLVVRRLTKMTDDANGKSRAQELIDTMFADMDLSLHEIGVSENKVGKKVKVMATAFMGRVKAYGAALDAGDNDLLVSALKRNVYRDADDKGNAKHLAQHMMRAASDLDCHKDADLLAGKIAPPINFWDAGNA